MDQKTNPLPDPLSVDDAINIVNQREHNSRLMQAEIYFIQRIAEAKEINEEVGEYYYYLLRCKLQRNILYETKDVHDLYQNMRDTFYAVEKSFRKNLRNSNKKSVERFRLDVFYRLATYYFGSLEAIYKKLSFQDSATHAYIDKKHFRQNHFFFSRKFFNWLGYLMMEMTSKYGNSFLRWGFSGVIVTSIFAVLFYLTDVVAVTGPWMVASGQSLYNYFYFSVVTFTTLGYGDVLPMTVAQKILANVEVITGYFMLGIFINLLNRKL